MTHQKEDYVQCFSPDNALLVLCNAKNVIEFWDTATSRLRHEFQPAEYLSSSVTCLAFQNVSVLLDLILL